MKLTLLLTLLAATTLTAQPQEVRIVTADVAVPAMGMGPGVQPMKQGHGVVFGQIMEADSTSPVSGAIVTLNLPSVQPLRVMTDSQGRFGFRDLPAGRFNITASRPGWVDGAYGRTRPAGPALPLALADGERVSGVIVPLWRYASVAGTVLDESGEPIVNAPVRVLKRTTVGGQVRLMLSSSDTTDDRGTYRVGMLEPGEYIVAVPMQHQGAIALPMGDMDIRAEAVTRELVAVRATMEAQAAGAGGAFFFNASPTGGASSAGVGEDGRPLSFPTMFYPNVTTSTRATVISVGTGEERSAVDFQLRGVPTSRVSGMVTGPTGPAQSLQITLVPAEAGESASSIETLTGFTDGQGRFTVEGVVPGQYILRTVRTPRMTAAPAEATRIVQGDNVMVFRNVGAAPLPNEPTLWAEMTLSVGATDLTDVSVGLRPGMKVTGMVQFNGAAERPTADRMSSISITLEPADVRPGVSNARGRVEPTGQFSTVGVPPGRYFIRVGGSYQGWTFHAAQAGGRDASVVAVDLDSSDLGGVMLSFTDRPSELSGQVQADGPPESVTVLVFPAEQAAWTGYGTSSRRFANTRADKAGAFKVTNLPAGDYLAVAIPDKMANDWQNPKFLEGLVADATRVRIRDGDKAVASLKVAR